MTWRYEQSEPMATYLATVQIGRYAVRRVGYVPTFVQAPQDVVRLAPPTSRAR